MDKSIAAVSGHMRELGLWALAHANWHAHSLSPDNPCWSELSVLQAAHAAEILIKARIAQEHPLLIFEHLPRQQTQTTNTLALEHLIEAGRTYQFSDLPDRLWAATGIRLPAPERYRDFGRLRNCIQHFTFPHHADAAEEAVRFIYEVVDPFIHTSWGLYAVDYNEDYEPYIYLAESLIRQGVRFLVSPRMVRYLERIEMNWPAGNDEFKQEMESRFAAARLDASRPTTITMT